MNVIVRPRLTLSDFLAWEREQPEKYEFDGTQPVPMTGGTVAHARLVRRIMEALHRLLPPGFEAFGGDLKVRTIRDRVRYPDALVLREAPAPDADIVEPVAVFEVLSASTMLTDLRVKPEEYAAVAALLTYVILPRDGPDGATVLRRSNGWRAEPAVENLDLPEVGVTIPLRELYGG
jgi:Uma2 family endonuclease